MNRFLNTNRQLLPSAPASAFVHIGTGTNMIFVDSEHDLVAVARSIDGGRDPTALAIHRRRYRARIQRSIIPNRE